MENISKYYVVSVKHTTHLDPYITLWNPNNAGYCFRTEVAGKYTHDEVTKLINYYNNGNDSIAVPCDVINKMTEMVTKGYLDVDGMVLPNSETNWNILVRNVIDEPKNVTEPDWNF